MRKKITKGRKKRGNTIKLVVKSNELVEARYMFDVWETRFFHSLIASIDRKDEDEKVYRLWFKDIKKTFQLKSNQSYSYLREAAISMAGKSVYIGWMNDQHRRGRMHRIIRFVDFLEKGQTGEGSKQQEYVDVSIDKDIKPYLLDIKKNFDPKLTRYTSYDLRNIIKLKPYATRIYELLKQFEYKGFRTILIDDLKDMFEIKDEYPRFSNFYQKVIVTSIDAINKNTDLRIPKEKIEKLKKGRKVHALRFMILTKTDEEVSILRDEFVPKTLFDEAEDAVVLEPEEEINEVDILFEEFQTIVVKQFGVTPRTFIKMLESGKYSREDIQQAVDVTRRANYNQTIKRSVPGFFKKALQDGFTDPKEEAKKAKRQNTDLEKKLLALQEAQTAAISERIREITAENDEITLQAIEAIIDNPVTGSMVSTKEKSIGRSLDTEDYRKDRQLRGMVINNIVLQQKDRFKDILKKYEPKIKALRKQLK